MDQAGWSRGDRATPSSTLVRRRLDASLARVRDHRLTLVTAPAGSGKTTLLGQLAGRWAGPVVWLRTDPSDADATHLLERLERALGEALGGADREGDPALVVVDDLHVIAGTPGERLIDDFVRNLPGAAVLVAAGRRPPAFDVSRLRVSGDLHEIGAGDLRFRSWEVDQLFRDVYEVALTPAELLELARRTGGWAAGLQLFHVATRGMPASDRRKVLSSLSGWSRMVRDYIVHNVLDELPAETQSFLVRTSVFDRFTAPLCDLVLGAEGSESVLVGLRAGQAFVDEVDDGVYRYQPLFASVLRSRLVDEVGPDRARALHRRAGEVLEDEGAVIEALAAYTRAEAWDAVEALVGAGGERATAVPSTWVEAMPDGLVSGDPWLRLARARQHLAAGELELAAAAYSAAEEAAGDPDLADVCRRERFGVQVWLDADWAGPLGWSGILRSATQRNPLAARREAAELPGPTGRLVEGMAASARRPHRRRGRAARHGGRRRRRPARGDGGRPAGDGYSGDRPRRRRRRRGGRFGRRRDRPAVAVCGRALAVLSVGDWGATSFDVLQLAQGRDRVGDRWGAALACLLGAMGAHRAQPGSEDEASAAGPLLEEAVARFHGLGAEVLESWARALLAVVRSREGHPDTWTTATAAEQLARRASVPGARAVALAALAVVRRAAPGGAPGGGRRGRPRVQRRRRADGGGDRRPPGRRPPGGGRGRRRRRPHRSGP